MNKKGFTLIELLATITIMGLLLLLISPSIKNLQKNNNKKKFEVYGKNLVAATKAFVQKEGEDITSIGTAEWTGCVDITYQELINSKLIKEFQDSNYDCSNSKVRLTKNEDGSSSYAYNLICTTTKSNKENYSSVNISGSSCSVKAVQEDLYATQLLISKANKEDLDYNDATDVEKKEMWTFTQPATSQTTALTDYRYIGADPNNYIKFNNELWRIIGVFDVDNGTGSMKKMLKIIRNESIGNYSWDNKTPETGAEDYYGKNEWTDARLNYLLNAGHESETYGGSLYWNRKSGTCYAGSSNATTSCDFTSTGLTSEAKAMIANAKWYLGGPGSVDRSIVTSPSGFYYNEREKRVYSNRNTSWTGKVGLIYPSDYGYATSGGSTNSRAECLSTSLLDWTDWYNTCDSCEECANNDWLFLFNQRQWTITTSWDNDRGVFAVSEIFGQIICNAALSWDGVHPVVHLKPTIKIKSGTGTSSDPYILK